MLTTSKRLIDKALKKPQSSYTIEFKPIKAPLKQFNSNHVLQDKFPNVLKLL